MKEQDYAFEALAEATDADWNANRGELNVALKSIKEQTELEGYELAAAIRDQAARYRSVMGAEVLLTPTALAKHWRRVAAESTRSRGATNQASVSHDECQTCGGDRFVVVSTRPAHQTRWMKERGIEVAGGAELEEYAGCPDCNPITVTQRRYDGQLITTPDPSRVRELRSQ